MLRAPYKPGEGFGLIERHETSGNIVLSPSFNPEGIGLGGFWDEYQRIRSRERQEGDPDADYLAAREYYDAAIDSAEGKLRMSLVPLSGALPGAKDRTILVDHSMLVFLLGLESVWDDLRKQYKDPHAKDGVMRVCGTVAGMARAHQQKWPSYRWNSQQKRIIDWCESASSGR
jgi:hypothetical protein